MITVNIQYASAKGQHKLCINCDHHRSEVELEGLGSGAAQDRSVIVYMPLVRPAALHIPHARRPGAIGNVSWGARFSLRNRHVDVNPPYFVLPRAQSSDSSLVVIPFGSPADHIHLLVYSMRCAR